MNPVGREITCVSNGPLPVALPALQRNCMGKVQRRGCGGLRRGRGEGFWDRVQKRHSMKFLCFFSAKSSADSALDQNGCWAVVLVGFHGKRTHYAVQNP